MKLNVSKYKELQEKSGLNDDAVIKATGLSPKSYQYVLDNGFIELYTLERIADAIKCSTQDIATEDSTVNNENVIEWLRDTKTALVTLTQGRYITKIKKYAQSNPDECKVLYENKDGSICAHIPVSWVKISPPKEVTEKQRETARQNITNYHSKNGVLQCEKG